MSTLAKIFCTLSNDCEVHPYILSKVSLMNQEVTLTMSEVPFLQNNRQNMCMLNGE